MAFATKPDGKALRVSTVAEGVSWSEPWGPVRRNQACISTYRPSSTGYFVPGPFVRLVPREWSREDSRKLNTCGKNQGLRR